MKTSSIFLLSLTATLVVPLGFFGAQANAQSTDANENTTSANPINSSSTENIGQQISNFVHNATTIFQQQRDETIQAIKDCREKAQNATADNRTQVMNDCHTTLTAIKEKYQYVRNQFQELFKQFRDSIITLRHHEEGLQVSDQDKDNAIKKINDDVAKHGIAGLGIALGHLKGMGENATMGVENALKHVNETNEYNQSGVRTMPGYQGQHGPPMSPGESASHGKH